MALARLPHGGTALLSWLTLTPLLRLPSVPSLFPLTVFFLTDGDPALGSDQGHLPEVFRADVVFLYTIYSSMYRI